LQNLHLFYGEEVLPGNSAYFLASVATGNSAHFLASILLAKVQDFMLRCL